MSIVAVLFVLIVLGVVLWGAPPTSSLEPHMDDGSEDDDGGEDGEEE